ncbi:MAG: endonuclease domain-containing protein [Balneolaceae bacterium]
MKAHTSNNFGYNKKLKKLASKNRKKATKAEACLWKFALSRKQVGFTFKRQRPVLKYIADFMCQELKLIIEVDGSSHDSMEVRLNDLMRQKELEKFGFTILRFTNEQVLENMDDVRRIILQVVDELGSRSSSL